MPVLETLLSTVALLLHGTGCRLCRAPGGIPDAGAEPQLGRLPLAAAGHQLTWNDPQCTALHG